MVTPTKPPFVSNKTKFFVTAVSWCSFKTKGTMGIATGFFEFDINFFRVFDQHETNHTTYATRFFQRQSLDHSQTNAITLINNRTDLVLAWFVAHLQMPRQDL